MVRNKKWNQLHQFLQYHVVNDSTHVACQLLSLESVYPPVYQLALDMMKRLGAYEQIVEVLFLHLLSQFKLFIVIIIISLINLLLLIY